MPTTLSPRVLFSLCFAAALGAYLFTLGPTVTGEDSGELVTAAYTMGIAHPPGYPTWTILGKLFTLIPVGSVAWRVNFMSAFFAAAASGMLGLLAYRLTRNAPAAIAAALAFAFSRELWEQAVMTEVYTLNAFLLVTCIYLLFRWQDTQRDAYVYTFAVLYGLSLGNHNTMVLMGPLFVLYVLYIDPRPWQHWMRYTICVVVSVAAVVLVHLYLPLRSLADPPMDWGNPETWQNFKDVVTRAQYSHMWTENPRTFGRFLTQLGSLAGLYFQQFSPWVGFGAIVALYALVRYHGMRGLFLLASFLMLTLGYLFILNTEMTRQDVWISTVFYIPSYLLLAVALAAGLAALHERLGARTGPERHVVPALVVLCVLSPLAYNWHHNDRSDYYWTHDYARNILESLDENAIYFPAADHATFPAIYLQSVKGLRLDVTIANKYGYPEETIYADMPEELRANLAKIPGKAEERFIVDWVIQNTDRPVYFTERRDMSGLPEDYDLVEDGLVFRIRRPGEELEDSDPWDAFTWHTLDPAETRGELTAEYVLGDYYYMRGRHLLASEEVAEGREAFEKVAAMNPTNYEMLNNLGSACAEFGLTDPGITYFKQALDAKPGYPTARRNLATLYMQSGDHRNALLQFEAMLRDDARDGYAVLQSARCLTAIEWFDDAIERYTYYVEHWPNDPRAFRELGEIFEQHKNDPLRAHTYYVRSLALDPNQPKLAEKVAETPRPNQEQAPAAPQAPTVPGLEGLLPQTPGLPSAAPGAGQGIPGLPTAPIP